MSSALYGVWIIGIFLVVVWSMRAEADPQARHKGLFGFHAEDSPRPETAEARSRRTWPPSR